MEISDASKAVFEAAKTGNIRVVKDLWEHRSKDELAMIVNSKFDKSTPLITAAIHGHVEVVRYLVESCYAKVELKGSARIHSPPIAWIKEGSPLYFAAAEGHLEIVKFLVEHSAEVDSRTDMLSTPLRIACIHGHAEVVKFLIAKGADVNQTNAQKHTPLHVAASWNNPDIVSCLITKGAQITSDDNGEN